MANWRKKLLGRVGFAPILGIIFAIICYIIPICVNYFYLSVDPLSSPHPASHPLPRSRIPAPTVTPTPFDYSKMEMEKQYEQQQQSRKASEELYKKAIEDGSIPLG
jgi:hypothetical protein